jgi:DNA-binding response OmpR family regulator
MQVLAKRLDDRGWDHTIVSSAITPDALVRMRLGALVLDVTVVGPDCWSYLESICTRLPTLAVVVCTEASSVAQRVRGLRLGVDAWVTKPCHPEELICVVEAAMRRHRRMELAVLEPPTVAGELMIRHELHQASVGEVSVGLTAREFEILALVVQSDRVLRREEIYERVWGYAMAHGDRSVDVFVRKLRQKLRAASPGWDYIHTHFGVGYRFAPLPDESFVSADEPVVQPQTTRSHLVYTGATED